LKFRFAFQKKQAEREAADAQGLCEFPGCEEAAYHPAPKKDVTSRRDDPTTWHWFCLNHVRDYNAQWNYYAHMGEAEILQEWKKDITWHRPSWPLGSWYGKFTHIRKTNIEADKAFYVDDPFGLFPNMPHPQDTPYTPLEKKAMRLLSLTHPFDGAMLQSAYRHMVKQHHPDVNTHPSSQEMMLKINESYQLLKKKVEALNNN
jgi:hypothetical protein